MNKPTLSLAEVAQRIVLERKFNKMIAEVALAIKASTRMLNEAGLPTGIDKSILAATKEVEAAGKDISDENVQAALVMAALEKMVTLARLVHKTWKLLWKSKEIKVSNRLASRAVS